MTCLIYLNSTAPEQLSQEDFSSFRLIVSSFCQGRSRRRFSLSRLRNARPSKLRVKEREEIHSDPQPDSSSETFPYITRHFVNYHQQLAKHCLTLPFSGCSNAQNYNCNVHAHMTKIRFNIGQFWQCYIIYPQPKFSSSAEWDSNESVKQAEGANFHFFFFCC